MKDSLSLAKVDYEIIDILCRNGRASSAKISATLGITESTVRSHIKKLISNRVIKIMAVINPEKQQNKFLAIIGITVNEPKLEERIIPKLFELKAINSVSIVTGRYDLLIEVFVNSRDELTTFITNELAKVDGLSSTETFLMLKTFNKWVC